MTTSAHASVAKPKRSRPSITRTSADSSTSAATTTSTTWFSNWSKVRHWPRVLSAEAPSLAPGPPPSALRSRTPLTRHTVRESSTRDLKPSNIMITPSGTKLLDFGLAKHTVAAPAQPLSMLVTASMTGTAPGIIIGTLQYMAPEQLQGAPVDARTDIFALGSILYEMVTGHRAFEATTQARVIAKILETDVPPVSTLTANAPSVLDHVVQTCLAEEAGDRWQSAHDIKLQLQRIQAQGSLTALAP